MVADIFMTPTAELADIVLPAFTFLEWTRFATYDTHCDHEWNVPSRIYWAKIVGTTSMPIGLVKHPQKHNEQTGDSLDPQPKGTLLSIVTGSRSSLLLFLRGGAGQAVEGGPVGPADTFGTTLDGPTACVDQCVEGWNHDKGQDRGQGQAENDGAGHGAPPLA